MLQRRLEYPFTDGFIFRRTLPELEKSHIRKLFIEYPDLRYLYNDQKKVLRLTNGSMLYFVSAPYEKDLASYYSTEAADMLVDEAQEFSQEELERLTGSLRCTSNPNITPKICYTFMPGVSESGLPPKGLAYLKRVLIDGDLRGPEKKLTWAFVQAFSWDNIEWARAELSRDGVGQGEHTPDDDSCMCQDCEFYSWTEEQRRNYFLSRTDYGAELAAITNKHLRDAWLYGKWDAFQGQYFPNFSYELHTVDPQEITIEPWHRRWISCDWGFDHPACVHWHTEDEAGRVTTYRELHVREMNSADLGSEISRLSGSERIVDFLMSWDAFGKLDPKTRKSLTSQLGEHLSRNITQPRPADSSPGSRISGWRLMYEMLDSRTWRISRDCEKLIACLPTLVRDMERNSEDVLKVDYSENYVGDDPADSARYGLQNMVLPKAKPWDVKRHEEVTKAIGDPENPNYQNAFFRDMELQDAQRKIRQQANTRSKSLSGRRKYL